MIDKALDIILKGFGALAVVYIAGHVLLAALVVCGAGQ